MLQKQFKIHCLELIRQKYNANEFVWYLLLFKPFVTWQQRTGLEWSVAPYKRRFYRDMALTFSLTEIRTRIACFGAQNTNHHPTEPITLMRNLCICIQQYCLNTGNCCHKRRQFWNSRSLDRPCVTLVAPIFYWWFIMNKRGLNLTVNPILTLRGYESAIAPAGHWILPTWNYFAIRKPLNISKIIPQHKVSLLDRNKKAGPFQMWYYTPMTLIFASIIMTILLSRFLPASIFVYLPVSLSIKWFLHHNKQ